MKMIRTCDAVGSVLCHDLTRIVRSEFKGAAFRKGHIIKNEDIPVLLSMGKEQIFVWEKTEGRVHEDEAASRLDKICRGLNIRAAGPTEGKIEHFAAVNGVFCIDEDVVNKINEIEGLVIVTRHNYQAVKMSEKLAGMKAIPLVIDEEKLYSAEKIAKKPLLNVMPFKLKNAGIIVTGSEVEKGLIKDTFSPVVAEKLESYGISVASLSYPGDDSKKIAAEIKKVKDAGADFIICTGGMSVDPDDNTPGAIKASGVRIVHYGAPVMPGAMFMLGYFDDADGSAGIPVAGLPGCVMFAGVTIFDIFLPRIAAGIEITKKDFTRLWQGGLCLNCEKCNYPVCPFGK
ncbi:molybdopterin biosynthesis protein [Spirochaetia bacterium]|nr:molybdopterin biosynthesis protein [Spirochaetia bacterium]